MKIAETYVNKDDNCIYGESGRFTPFTTNRKQLFQSLQREYGRCTSTIYVDQLQINGRMASIPVGWVFEKRAKYTDTNEPYLREVWVNIYESEE